MTNLLHYSSKWLNGFHFLTQWFEVFLAGCSGTGISTGMGEDTRRGEESLSLTRSLLSSESLSSGITSHFGGFTMDLFTMSPAWKKQWQHDMVNICLLVWRIFQTTRTFGIPRHANWKVGILYNIILPSLLTSQMAKWSTTPSLNKVCLKKEAKNELTWSSTFQRGDYNTGIGVYSTEYKP